MSVPKLGPSITLILIPQAHMRSLNLRLPIAVVVLAFITALSLFAGVAAYGIHLVNAKQSLEVAASRLESLQAANVKQAHELDVLAAEARNVADELVKLQNLNEQIQVILKHDPATAVAAPTPALAEAGNGQGGPGAQPESFQSSPEAITALAGGASDTQTARRAVNPLLSARSFARSRSRSGDTAGPDGEQLIAMYQSLREQSARQAQELRISMDALQGHIEYLAHLPTGMPIQGELTSNFGTRWSPFGWGRQFHAGIDVAGPYGMPIQATAAGTVVFAGWKDGGYGRTVIVDHGYGFQTLYAHAQEILVEPGDEIARGHVVAKVGSTGNSTGPHVHYEVHLWGEEVDPTPYTQ